VEGKGATALLASRSPLIDRAVPTLASSRTLSVHASNPQPRARAQMDANRVEMSDSDRLHWEHANASFTACSCERHVPPRLQQMKPRVRRGLVGLNVKDNRTSRRMVCRARNSTILEAGRRARSSKHSALVAIGAVSLIDPPAVSAALWRRGQEARDQARWFPHGGAHRTRQGQAFETHRPRLDSQISRHVDGARGRAGEDRLSRGRIVRRRRRWFAELR
jgi:hypothetical protein